MPQHRVLPLSSYLQRYSTAERLILDCSTTGVSQAAGVFSEGGVLYSAEGTGKKVDKYGESGMRHLRIHLPSQYITETGSNSGLLSRLSQALTLPDLRELHIVCFLLEDGLNTAPPGQHHIGMTLVKGLESVVARCKYLHVVKLCIRLMLTRENRPAMTCDLWVSYDRELLIIYCNLKIN
jgi:hypothetical protein